MTGRRTAQHVLKFFFIRGPKMQLLFARWSRGGSTGSREPEAGHCIPLAAVGSGFSLNLSIVRCSLPSACWVAESAQEAADYIAQRSSDCWPSPFGHFATYVHSLLSLEYLMGAWRWG